MKKTLIVSVIGLLFLTACNSNNSTKEGMINITSSQAQEINDDVKKIITDNGIELDKQEIYVPIILVEAQKLDSITINKTKEGSITVEYLSDSNTPYKVKNYELVSIKIGNITREERNETESTLSELYKKFKKDGKEYYISSEYKSEGSFLLINFLYYIDETTYCFVVVKINRISVLSEKIAESIYNDFQCISLKELGKLGS